MAKVLLNDCNPDASLTLTNMLKDNAEIIVEPFSEQRELTDFNLVLLYSDSTDDQQILRKIKNLHFRTKFRNIPIILLKDKSELFSDQPYFNFGVSEFMALDEPQPIFNQILQGYLNPGRQPLERELIYLTPFIESTKTVLSKMASMEAEFRGVYFQNSLRILGDVSGVIGLSGTTEGTVIITFLWNLARQVIANIMEVKENEINAEMIHDGVGEIINMISGSAKKSLLEASYDFQLSIPTIIVGWGHEVGHPDNATIAVLTFDVGDQAFVLHISLTQK
ncbi:MAG: chemotaxis protein CheX [Proteobacteria bacterium]|nr:chemotaxis protein CheX [Pseudomonadota bacterium]